MIDNPSKRYLRKYMNEQLRSYIDSDTFVKKYVFFNKESAKLIQSFEPFRNADLVLAYFPMKYEAPCNEIINHALAMGKTVGLPKINEKSLTFHICNSIDNKENFSINNYGIFEPLTKAIDFNNIFDNGPNSIIVFVPGLAFNTNGSRLGRGKAYYDNFLHYLLNLQKISTSKISLCFVGLCFSFQVIESVPVESHDISMNYILTENGLN